MNFLNFLVITNSDDTYSLKLEGYDAPIPYSTIGSWIDAIDTKIKLLELARRQNIDRRYLNETLKERKKRAKDDTEWEFIKLHPVRPNFNDIKCLNDIIAECSSVDNIYACKGVYRLKGSEIIICDVCKNNNWDIHDIKMEIENSWRGGDVNSEDDNTSEKDDSSQSSEKDDSIASSDDGAYD